MRFRASDGIALRCPERGNSRPIWLPSKPRVAPGEHYNVAHNHDRTRVTNFGVAFGGELTLIKVEPSEAVQGTKVGDFVVTVCERRGRT